MKLMNMSYREDKVLSLAGDGLAGLDRGALQKQCTALVNAKILRKLLRESWPAV